jgi:hypothetical protein
MKFRSLIVAAGMVIGAHSAALADDDAVAMVQAFCSLRAVEGGNAIMHLVSPSLGEAIGVALAENAKVQAAMPDEKPPLGDGIPWQSYPDLSDTCEPGTVTAEGDGRIAEVKHGFASNAGAAWTDRLVLQPGEGGVLLIDDIRYGAEGESDTLRGLLVGVFSQ